MNKIPVKKIAVVTSTRAEYGLLSMLMHAIKNDPALALQTIVTGTHLSPEFGLTYQHIENDGFDITAKVEMLMSSDTAVGVTKSMGLALISLADTFKQYSSDLLILLGDRFETLAIAQAALMQKIPIAHIHGGELSVGAIDDAMRHAITKLSHLHFVAHESYRQRVIQMGEQPNRVFTVGAPGIERIHHMSHLSLEELEEALNFKLGTINFLVTFHPATLAINDSLIILDNLLAALEQFPEATLIFTLANADESGRAINQKINNFVQKHKARAKAFVSLGDRNYLSLLQFIDVVIGNSSSGIVEVPYFHKPTVNIGTRQAKRLRASSIIDCSGFANTITAAIELACSAAFKKQLTNTKLAYELDNTAEKITTLIKTMDLKQLMHKDFYDMGCV